MADIYSLTIRADTRDVTRAKQALDGLASGSMRATRATKQVAQGAKQMGVAGRASSHQMRQVAMQLSQVASQGSVTGNFMQALAIQLPDLALAFGPVGIAAGALVGALGTYAFRAKEAEEQTASLAERIGNLRDSVEDLTEAQIQGLKVEFFAENRQRQMAIMEERENIRDLTKELTQLKEAERAAAEQALMSGGSSAQLTELQEEIGRVDSALTIARGSLQTYFNEADAASQGLQELIDGSEGAADAAEKQREKLDELVESLKVQAETIDMNARQTALYEAARLGANEADLAAINNSFNLIESYRKQQALQKALIELTKIDVGDDPLLQRMEAQRRGMELMAEESEYWTQKMADNQQQISQSMMSTMGDVFGTLKTFTEEGTAEWAAMVMAQKGIMAAQAFMAANLAATLALASPMAGVAPGAVIAQAETMRTLGYINAGLILAQGVGEIAGARQMGGSVSGGSSYLVGENGPEIVTMGGSGVVTPSTFDSANDSGDVIVNINNAPPGTRTESRTDDQGNRFIDVFVSDIANGGPMSKAVQGTYGLRRQGR